MLHPTSEVAATPTAALPLKNSTLHSVVITSEDEFDTGEQVLSQSEGGGRRKGGVDQGGKD